MGGHASRGSRHDPQGASDGALPRRWHAALVVGYACYLSYFPIGSLGAVYLGQVTEGWEQVLLVRSLFLLATILAIRAWALLRADGFSGPAQARRVRASFALVVASFPMLFAASRAFPGAWAAGLFAALLGAATSAPKIGWYEAFQHVYEHEGRSRCVADVAACFLVAAAPIALVPVMGMGPAASACVLAGLAALSWALFEAMARGLAACRGLGAAAPAPGGARPAEPRGARYRATPYTLAVLLGFGFAWGMSFTLSVTLGYGSGQAQAAFVMVAGLVASAAVIAAVTRLGAVRRMQFGMLLRLVIAAVGTAWALMAFVAALSPALACFEISVVYILESTIMILFIAEICTDYHLTACVVTGVHFGTFVSASLAAAAVYCLAFELLPEHVALALVSGLAAAAFLLMVPFLPSRGSAAGAFAMESLPDDGTRGDAVEAAARSLCARAGLTRRESEVLGCIVAGMSRERAAEELSVSVYTVKNHMASIYAKAGVHGRAELLALVYGAAVDDDASARGKA